MLQRCKDFPRQRLVLVAAALVVVLRSKFNFQREFKRLLVTELHLERIHRRRQHLQPWIEWYEILTKNTNSIIVIVIISNHKFIVCNTHFQVQFLTKSCITHFFSDFLSAKWYTAEFYIFVCCVFCAFLYCTVIILYMNTSSRIFILTILFLYLCFAGFTSYFPTKK